MPPQIRNSYRLHATESVLLAVILAFYAVYAFAIIWRSSFLVDGVRHFCLFDDAMISMRYAWHFAAGHGLVWNPGERVEGFTNPGWTLLMALIHKMDSRLPITSLYIQLLSLASLVGTAVTTWLLSLQLRPAARMSALVAAITVAFYFPLNFFSLMGMETGIVSFLITLALLLLIRSNQAGRSANAAWALFGLATLIRLDAVVPLLASAAASFIAFPQTRWKNLSGAVAVLIIAVGSQTLLRAWYYDSWLPNTYYLKMSGVSLDDRVSRGLYVTSRFIFNHLWPLYVLLVVWAVAYFRNRHCIRQAIASFHRSPWLPLVAVVAGQLAYSAYVGGDVWEHEFYANRFTVIAIPALYILIVHALVETASRSRTLANAIAARPLLIAIPLTLALIVQSNWHSGYVSARKQAVLLSPPYLTDEARQFAVFAHKLRYSVPTTTTLALDRAGTLPYFTPHHHYFDILGKTDPVIARLPSRQVADSLTVGSGFVPGHTKWSASQTLGHHKPHIVILSLSGISAEYAPYLEKNYRRLDVPNFTFDTYLRTESYDPLASQILSTNH